MSLKERLVKVSAVGGLAACLAVSGCAMTVREGDERASVFVMPFIPVASVSHEKYESGTNKVIEKQEINVSSWFGTGYVDIKNYKEGKYIGMCKIKIQNDWGEIKARTEIYDENNKLLKSVDGMPEDLPDDVKAKIGNSF